MRITNLFAAASALALVPSAAFAQAEVAPEESVFDGDYLTIGAAGVYGPSYEGSDDQVLYPVPVVQGKLAGIGITPRQGGIGLDLIPDGDDPSIGFSLGPVVTYSRNRHSQIKDPVVRSAGKLKDAIDVGGNAGVTFYKLLSPYDSLSVAADVKWNVNKAHRGMVINPTVSYVTPLSKAMLATVVLSAKHVDDDYADYYYSVSPAQAAASGLPLYQAKGGWANFGASALVAYDIDGNLLNGGFAVFGAASYTRLVKDAKRTPYTSIRGDASQWVLGAGVAYTF
jgi:outer membrane scaffolding protein for murein synthesis (MipA/OmpV family)